MSARGRAVGVVLVALAVLCVPRLHAQAIRQGLWVGVGLGAGRLAMTCDWCGDDQTEDGGLGTLSLAVAPSAKFKLALEVTGWVGAGGTATERQGSLMLAARFIPSASFPAFVEGGVGLDRLKLPFGASSEAAVLRANTLGFRGGVGAELPVRADLLLVPRLTLTFAPTATMSVEGEGPADEYQVSSRVIGLSLGILYRIPRP